MRASIPLGRWFGVPVGLHYSWLIIAWIITISLGSQFAAANPNWATATVWTMAIVTALLFFVSLVAHELSHSLVARMNGIPVRGITLFALGGVSQIERDSSTAGSEFAIAIAGPAASFLIGAACLVLARMSGWTASAAASSPGAAVLGWLGYINLMLGAFNLVPGFPLDGGRVLRAVIWHVTRDGDRATRLAAGAGVGIAVLFIAFGLFGLFTRGAFGGLWIAIIGWFLLDAAQGQLVMAGIASSLRGLRVADIMARDCEVADPRMSLAEFVEQHLLRTGGRCVEVVRNGDVVGIITPRDVRAIDRARWPETTVADAMRPLASLTTIASEAPASMALTVMGRAHVNQLPVVDHGHVAGFVTRAHLIDVLQLTSPKTTAP